MYLARDCFETDCLHFLPPNGVITLFWFPDDNFLKYYPVSFKSGTIVALRSTLHETVLGLTVCTSSYPLRGYLPLFQFQDDNFPKYYHILFRFFRMLALRISFYEIALGLTVCTSYPLRG